MATGSKLPRYCEVGALLGSELGKFDCGVEDGLAGGLEDALAGRELVLLAPAGDREDESENMECAMPPIMSKTTPAMIADHSGCREIRSHKDDGGS